MEKFNGVTEPAELEFYSIENGKTGKNIHLMGYTYDSECDNGQGTWRLLEPCFVIVPIAEFIEGVKSSEGYTDNLISEAKQYIEDMDEQGVVECINEYFNGKPADYRLHYSEITIDTPCGNYVS